LEQKHVDRHAPDRIVLAARQFSEFAHHPISLPSNFRYCIVSGVADVLGNAFVFRPGDWFDLAWGVVGRVALVTAVRWNGKEEGAAIGIFKPRHTAFEQLFPLLFPGLIMALLGRVAQYYPIAAGTIG